MLRDVLGLLNKYKVPLVEEVVETLVKSSTICDILNKSRNDDSDFNRLDLLLLDASVLKSPSTVHSVSLKYEVSKSSSHALLGFPKRQIQAIHKYQSVGVCRQLHKQLVSF